MIAGATGATLAYFFDPDQGRRRRAIARDRANSVIRRGRRAAAARREDVVQQAAAAAARVASAARPAPPYDDDTLADVVMTHLFEDSEIKARVNVSAQKGVVVLIGEVPDPDAVVARTRKIKGVGEVKSLLHAPGTAAPHMA